MGNRAVITGKGRTVGIYLHWNGSRSSVEAFLRYCELKHFRSCAEDEPYALARLAQVIANFFGGGLSIGIVPYTTDEEMAAGLDNGVYLIDEWRIDGRVFPHEEFVDEKVANLMRNLHSIDEAQPLAEQLGSLIDAPEVAPRQLALGDRVWVYTDYRQVGKKFQGGYLESEVLGFGDGLVDGENVVGVPYVGLFPDKGGDCSTNLSNYLLEPTYQLIQHSDISI